MTIILKKASKNRKIESVKYTLCVSTWTPDTKNRYSCRPQTWNWITLVLKRISKNKWHITNGKSATLIHPSPNIFFHLAPLGTRLTYYSTCLVADSPFLTPGDGASNGAIIFRTGALWNPNWNKPINRIVWNHTHSSRWFWEQETSTLIEKTMHWWYKALKLRNWCFWKAVNV